MLRMILGPRRSRIKCEASGRRAWITLNTYAFTSVEVVSLTNARNRLNAAVFDFAPDLISGESHHHR